MQTNREHVGNCYLDIRIPIPRDFVHAAEISAPFRNYYQNLAKARDELRAYFSGNQEHHFFIGTAEEVPDEIASFEEDDAYDP